MTLTLEDLDCRVTVLEKGADREKTIERAVAEIVSESEQRLEAKVAASEQRLEANIAASEQRMGARITEVELRLGERIDRLDDRIGATERRFVDLLNERFDAVMVALDRLQSPPRDLTGSTS
jgi:hypothetical protein